MGLEDAGLPGFGSVVVILCGNPASFGSGFIGEVLSFFLFFF